MASPVRLLASRIPRFISINQSLKECIVVPLGFLPVAVGNVNSQVPYNIGSTGGGAMFAALHMA